MSRIIIVGGPRTGKSTLAKSFGVPVRCGDPESKVKESLPGVTYLPEMVKYGCHHGDQERCKETPFACTGAAAWVSDNWFKDKGPWVCEGHVMARALRKFDLTNPISAMPANKIIVLENQYDHAVTLPGQVKLHEQTMKIWREISWRFEAITEYR